MKEYRFDTAYTKENIKILTNIQFQTYKWKVQAAVFLTGVFLIGIAAFGVHSQKWSLLLLVFGCWLCVSPSYPSGYLTKQICMRMQDENKQITYVFSNQDIHIVQGTSDNRLSYHRIHRIVETKKAFCIFVSPASGFLLLKDSLGDFETLEEFRKFLRKCTQLEIEREEPWWLRCCKLRWERN